MELYRTVCKLRKKLKIIPLEITGNSGVFCRKFGQKSSNKHLPLQDLEKHTHDLELLSSTPRLSHKMLSQKSAYVLFYEHEYSNSWDIERVCNSDDMHNIKRNPTVRGNISKQEDRILYQKLTESFSDVHGLFEKCTHTVEKCTHTGRWYIYIS